MDAPPNGLVDLLALEEIERNIFRGRNETGQRERLFGGQVAAQALAAAGRTVEGRAAHSLHAYFLRPGDPSIPVLYTVERIRDGQSFTTRRVVAVQYGSPDLTAFAFGSLRAPSALARSARGGPRLARSQTTLPPRRGAPPRKVGGSTDPSSTAACSPTRPTCRCSTRSSCPTAAPGRSAP